MPPRSLYCTSARGWRCGALDVCHRHVPEHDGSTYALRWRNRNPLSVYRQCYFYHITECFYGFLITPVPVPSNTPTIPCKPSAILAHPLNIMLEGGSPGRFYNFENEDFLYEAPTYRHLLVEDSGPSTT